MWEALQKTLTSDNFLKAVLGISALLTLLAILVKLKVVSFKGKGLVVGQRTNEEELNIIRAQIGACESHSSALRRDIERRFENNEVFDKYRLKYTIERVLDELVRISVLNHITLDPIYIKSKQDSIWSVVSNINPFAEWDDLEDLVRSRVELAIRSLHEIRLHYR